MPSVSRATLEPHPDYTDRRIPEEIRLGDFRLTMLTEADLDDDMAAIGESMGELEGIFGVPWPRGLTREADRADLVRHRREFAARHAFAWVIRDRAGAYLGCAYVRPSLDRPASARVAHWMRSGAKAHGPAFAALFHDWLRGPPWPHMAMTVISHP